ncbi:MAG: SDR family NAD(P)-dependent oxidoreductase [[Clostridium] scindens]
MLDFDGQVVIVTGSGSPKGIGKTIAKTFAKQKAAVVIADMNEAGVQDCVSRSKNWAAKAFGVTVVSDDG